MASLRISQSERSYCHCHIKKESYSKVISLSYFVVCNHYGFTRFNVLSGVLLDGVTKLVQTIRIYNSFQLLHRIWHVFLRRQRHPLTLLCKFKDYTIPCSICIYIFIFAYLADKKCNVRCVRLLNEKATVNRNRGGQLNVEIKLSVEIVSNLDKAGVPW